MKFYAGEVEGGLNPDKISGVVINFGLLVHVLRVTKHAFELN